MASGRDSEAPPDGDFDDGPDSAPGSERGRDLERAVIDARARLLAAAGSVSAAIAATTRFERAVWSVLYPTLPVAEALGQRLLARPAKQGKLPLDIEAVARAFAVDSLSSDDDPFQIIVELVRLKCEPPGVPRSLLPEPTLLAPRELFYSPLGFTRAILAPAGPSDLLCYAVLRDTRRHYRALRDSLLASQFRALAARLYVQAEGRRFWRSDALGLGGRARATARRAPLLDVLLEPFQEHDAAAASVVGLFLECCRIAGYVEPGYKSNEIRLATSEIDAEYLLSQLFGIPSGIAGFDELFGGGGITFAEMPQAPGLRVPVGRSLLIKGKFGSGKSLLAAELAASVARKGGLAWIMALEQPAEDYVYSLASFGRVGAEGAEADASTPISQGRPREELDIHVATSPESVAKTLDARARNPDSERGALVILPSIRDSFADFLELFERAGKGTGAYPLRLVCIDPVNSVCREDPASGEIPIAIQRQRLLDAMQAVKRDGTNVVLVSEDSSDDSAQIWFEQNIVDTVIHLTESVVHGYSRRYIEVSKSRFQREQRGKHPYSIRQSLGFRVFPSVASIDARIRPRKVRIGQTPSQFGLPDVDAVLGADPFRRGEVVVLRGRSGSYKTSLALAFLARQEEGVRAHSSLYVSSLRTQDWLDEQKENWLHSFMRGKTGMNPDRIRLCPLRLGHIHPAEVLRTIESEFERAKLERRPIDRVVVDDLAHWELGCPSIREDETFSDTLINLLQRNRVTSLVVCGNIAEATDAPVQRPILSRASCIVTFDRFEFRGRRHVSLRVDKTRGMEHDREAQEVIFDETGLTLRPTISMFRVSSGDEARMVPVRLLLHAESEAQAHYISKLAATISSVLSTETRIDPQSALSMRMATDLSDVSAIDELQIVHLDEFQLPEMSARGARDGLRVFTRDEWTRGAQQTWDDFIPRLAATAAGVGNQLVAAPFYADIGFLVYRTGAVGGLELALADTSLPPAELWQRLASACEAWERDQSARAPESDGPALFFDFPHVTLENYTCLFLEILACFAPPPEVSADRAKSCHLIDWLSSPHVPRAAAIFWRLGMRAHAADAERRRRARERRVTSGDLDARPHQITSGDRTLNSDLEARYDEASDVEGSFFRVSPKALVWRHWYSTLSQMLSRMTLDERSKIVAVPVPGRSMAGEWYMAIPSYSAAPGVGMRILRQLASRQANAERLYAGVGLPTLRSFYERADPRSRFAPNFAATSLQIQDAIEGALPRSRFGCYADAAAVLGHHLVRMLELPMSSTAEVLDQLREELCFTRSKGDCETCRGVSHQPR
ncbi:MAG TPA: ATPase domain-containing protein [Polyangiaceae bacterium]|nr:ATPase domain-containing protein [Polyangiaceae bacterium]